MTKVRILLFVFLLNNYISFTSILQIIALQKDSIVYFYSPNLVRKCDLVEKICNKSSEISVLYFVKMSYADLCLICDWFWAVDKRC